MHAPALTPVDVSSIKALGQPFIEACLDRDWDALLALCTDDVVFMPPDEPVLSGREAVRRYLEKYPVMRTFDFEFTHIEGQDHLAVAHGTFTMTIEVDPSPVDLTGKFMDAFRRDDHGRWLYASVIWNSDQPA
ncbi:MAG TPA: nuclear transport factor 2 family protein [Gemmatimonadales bacterium]|nr:nuclear transport factor 2 family protein [Gemmatimonadales bacterium]